MQRRIAAILLLSHALAFAAVIDRVAIVVGGRWIVKDSDIERDVRATEFLNGQPLNLGKAARKESANRLIDQLFIRREILIGDYPQATPQQADQQIERLKKGKYKTEAAFQSALQRYGMSEVEMRTQFQLQLTVLQFIDVRFKPAVLVTDDEVEKYYRNHAAALRHDNPGKSLDDLREQIRDLIAGERVNQQFFAWLNDQRKNSKVEFLEESLA